MIVRLSQRWKKILFCRLLETDAQFLDVSQNTAETCLWLKTNNLT
jgi:hypothetical protein